MRSRDTRRAATSEAARAAAGLVLALALSALACASAFMSGFESVKAPPANPTATYRVKSCTTVDSGEKTPVDLRYYLADEADGPVLYEFASAGGTGSKITNHFTDAEGTHFVLYVRTSHGYEMVVPQDNARPGERRVFLAGTFKAYRDQEGGPMKLRGTPQIRCPMEPEASQ